MFSGMKEGGETFHVKLQQVGDKLECSQKLSTPEARHRVYLNLQSGTFTGSGAGLPTPAFVWIWSGTCSKSLYVDSQGFAFFVVCICLTVNPLLMQRNLFAKCARLPVPLFSHSTGFSKVHTGSIRSV